MSVLLILLASSWALGNLKILVFRSRLLLIREELQGFALFLFFLNLGETACQIVLLFQQTAPLQFSFVVGRANICNGMLPVRGLLSGLL
jgi:hypothetical protein